MSKNIIVVTKDIAEFLIYFLLVSALRERGHNVTVIAEGISLDKWLEKDEAVARHFSGSTECEFEIFLAGLKPDLVLTGLADPINWGEKFGLAANKLGIKLGYVIDVWGAESRSTAVPNFICTLDNFARERILNYHPFGASMPKVYITGSPAMDSLAKVKIPTGFLGNLANCNERTILFCGQNIFSASALEGLIQALNDCQKEIPCILIPRFHPKFMQRADHCALWNAILAKAKGYVLHVPTSTTSQQLMMLAGLTVSVFSNALIEAAALGSLPVSWNSENGRKNMSSVFGGLTRFPLVDCGCAVEVETPADFISVLRMAPVDFQNRIRRCKAMYRGDGNNTQRVTEAVTAELA
ncbi:MAG: hypothetical protein EXS46_00685 [Candidatus Taylorbacteria bacterium]|nr:hypothetical protein [Candidatus Taylorbacteria bacterium]